MESSVLLLNATYEPIACISFRRAVVLVLQEKAEVVSEGVGFVRSASMEMPLPSVIRLVRYVKVPHTRKAYLSRRTVLRRDDHICCYCGGRANTMDHILPRSRGGAHSWMNVVACCYDCNQRKDDRTPEEMGWKLRFQPYVPEGGRRLVIIVGSIDPSWEPWVSVA